MTRKAFEWSWRDAMGAIYRNHPPLVKYDFCTFGDNVVLTGVNGDVMMSRYGNDSVAEERRRGKNRFFTYRQPNSRLRDFHLAARMKSW
jgi:hypothetical protein